MPSPALPRQNVHSKVTSLRSARVYRVATILTLCSGQYRTEARWSHMQQLDCAYGYSTDAHFANLNRHFHALALL